MMEKKKIFLVLVILVLGAVVISACSGSSEAADDHAEPDEHVDAPSEYANLTNPFAGDHEAAEAGAKIYEVNCASCHGPEGKGDGPAAAGLDPQPASLADAHMMEEMNDGALFWRVNEGGMMEPFNSVMPAWKGTLSEDEIWQVITYIREFAEDDHD
ncbi:MAG: c-type cytochrome [Anaerolineales bacterium]|nr:c-type cytochrome [Anaerolineales bacterium]